MAGLKGQPAFSFIRHGEVSPGDYQTHNLFLCLKPPAAIAKGIADKVEPIRLTRDPLGRPVRAERLHVSLISLGVSREPERLVEPIGALMAGFDASPAELRFDRLASFGGSSVVLWGGEYGRVQALCRRLMARLAVSRHFRRRAPGRMEPHMTVFHSARRFAETPVEPCRWTASEVMLIYSHKGHRTLGVWPLTRPDDRSRHGDRHSAEPAGGRQYDLFAG